MNLYIYSEAVESGRSNLTGDSALRTYNIQLRKYRKAESNALFILTGNMTDGT